MGRRKSVNQERPTLERAHGLVLSPCQMRMSYEPLDVLKRKDVSFGSLSAKRSCDGRVGVLDYQEEPRYYFNFHVEEVKETNSEPLPLVTHSWAGL